MSNRKSKKIIIDLHNGIGDGINAIPMLQILRENHPSAVLEGLVRDNELGELLKRYALIDDYFNLQINNITRQEIIKCLQLRKKRYDIGIIATASSQKKWKWLFTAIGCKKIIFRKPENEFDSSFVSRNMALVAQLGIKPDARYPLMDHVVSKTLVDEFCACNEIASRIRDSKIVGVCVRDGASVRYDVYQNGTSKALRPDKLIELINIITSEGYSVALIGGTNDRLIIDENCTMLSNPDKIYDFVGMLSLMDSVALMYMCDVVIGGDFGLIHCAAALQIPVVVYYGATPPELVGPFSERLKRITLGLDCQYCYATPSEKMCTDRKCVKHLSTTDIWHSAKSFLH